MGSLGKKKGDKITRALADFNIADSDHAVVAGKRSNSTGTSFPVISP